MTLSVLVLLNVVVRNIVILILYKFFLKIKRVFFSLFREGGINLKSNFNKVMGESKG